MIDSLQQKIDAHGRRLDILNERIIRYEWETGTIDPLVQSRHWQQTDYNLLNYDDEMRNKKIMGANLCEKDDRV